MCVKEDREVYGETYWHRKHQIRNMSICTKHKCRLKASNVFSKSEQSFTFCPAESYIGNEEADLESDPLMIRFASYLDSVFDAPIDFENDVPISAILYDGMSRTKYLKPSGRSRYTKMLADDMGEFYRSMGICSIASIYQVQKALLGNLFDFTVICQVAFFLGMRVEELTKSFLSKEQIQREQESHYMKDAAPVDWERLDMETALVLEKFAKGVYDGTGNENGRPERVSERLVYREMGLLGHQLENMPGCKAVMERYAESYPESWARKIVWAYRKLEEEGKTFYWTDIRRISGVKKKNIQLVIPYLRKYTDDVIVKRIMKLIAHYYG